MISEAFDFRFLLIENYKKLKLKENELAVIFVIDHLTSQGNPFVTADLLSLKMSMSVKEIDIALVELLNRGFIEYATKDGKTITSLDPLKEQLFREFQLTINKESSLNNEDSKKELDNVFANFEKYLGRTLSPIEISKIREWVAFGYSDSRIIDALKEALNKGKKSLRSVDKILLTWAKRDDIEDEGATAIDDEWDKNLEETIRIAKTPWIK